jgi:hypothetical protein
MNWADKADKYLRHKLKSAYFNSDEYKRLRGISSSAPGPTPWHAASLPSFLGPDGLELRWRKLDHMVVVLGSEDMQQNYLAVGGYCYILPLSRDRLCLWYQSTSLHLLIIGTQSLKSLGTVQDVEGHPKTRKSSVDFISGLIAETEFPIPNKVGKYFHQFPDEMRPMKELLVLGFVAANRPRNSAIYVMKPSENTVEVLPMDWWNKGGYDYGYEWVTKIARDPKTLNIVGEGIRILPFLLDQSGTFLGWIEESKPPAAIRQ